MGLVIASSGQKLRRIVPAFDRSGNIRQHGAHSFRVWASRLGPRLGGGAIKKADRPRQLLNRKGVFIQKLVRSGDMAIMRRVGKDRYPLQMLYILEPSGQIKKQFDFYDDANATARRAFGKNFARAFARAKKTAKRR